MSKSIEDIIIEKQLELGLDESALEAVRDLALQFSNTISAGMTNFMDFTNDVNSM